MNFLNLATVGGRVVSIHKTFHTGAQMGYARNPAGPGFVAVSRGSSVEAWTVKGPIYTSWVAIANLIDHGSVK